MIVHGLGNDIGWLSASNISGHGTSIIIADIQWAKLFLFEALVFYLRVLSQVLERAFCNKLFITCKKYLF